MLTFRVAMYYRVSPEEVEDWHNRDFLDRAEYMCIQEEIDRQHHKYIEQKQKAPK